MRNHHCHYHYHHHHHHHICLNNNNNNLQSNPLLLYLLLLLSVMPPVKFLQKCNIGYTLYSWIHYLNSLQKLPTSPRHNPRMGIFTEQLSSYYMLEQHISQEARMISQHLVFQRQTISDNTLEFRYLILSLEYSIILIQSRLRLI